MTQPPAGWYPDPAPQQPGQQPQVRYWDGQAWTQHVHPAAPEQGQQPPPYAGQQATPPAAPPYAGQYGGQQPGQPGAPQPAQPGGPQPGQPGEPQQPGQQPGQPGGPQPGQQPGQPGGPQPGQQPGQAGAPQYGGQQPGQAGAPQYAGQYAGPPGAPQYAGQYAPQYAGQYGAQYAGPTTPDGVPLSGWWRRVGAFLIDSVLVGIVGSLVTIPQQVQMQEELIDLGRRLENETTANPEAVPDLGAYFQDYMDILGPFLLWSGIVSFILWALYSGLMLRFKGATLGKMALGIAVRLRDQPGQLPWSAIAMRVLVQFWVYLTAVVPYLYFALVWWPALDVLWAAWDGKRQALHDKAARTNVVRVR